MGPGFAKWIIIVAFCWFIQSKSRGLSFSDLTVIIWTNWCCPLVYVAVNLKLACRIWSNVRLQDRLAHIKRKLSNVNRPCNNFSGAICWSVPDVTLVKSTDHYIITLAEDVWLHVYSLSLITQCFRVRKPDISWPHAPRRRLLHSLMHSLSEDISMQSRQLVETQLNRNVCEFGLNRKNGVSFIGALLKAHWKWW